MGNAWRKSYWEVSSKISKPQSVVGVPQSGLGGLRFPLCATHYDIHYSSDGFMKCCSSACKLSDRKF